MAVSLRVLSLPWKLLDQQEDQLQQGLSCHRGQGPTEVKGTHVKGKWRFKSEGAFWVELGERKPH